MKQSGMTLIELVVVVAIIGILVMAMAFQFVGLIQRGKVESQIKTMQVDMMDARARAMGRNVQYVVALSADRYDICEDTPPFDGQCLAGELTTGISKTLSKSGLRYPVRWNLTVMVPANTVLMSGRGFVTPDGTIWLLNPETGAVYDTSEVDYDCIVTSLTKINIGKYNGATCDIK
ncbi:MAG: type II secretion system GspH family protein [Nitrospirae bacterium]|nr:type II secretion system GspH family protein [Nitrospirota bacterium]